MIHVPDVRGTVAWYKSIGFQVVRTNKVDGETDWAKMTFGNSELMFSAAGRGECSASEGSGFVHYNDGR
jgi:hypothetical protein